MPELVGSAAVPSAHPLRGDGLPLAFTNERLSEAEPSRTASRSASDHSSWKAAATRIVSPAPGEGTGANDVQASSQQREEQDGAEDAIRSDADGHTLASDQSGKARADKSNGSTPHREDDDLKDGPGVKDPHLVSGGDLEKGGNCASDGEGDAPKDQRTELQDQTNFLPTRQVIIVFLGLALALFISLLDQTIVSTALSSITAAFGAGEDASWLGTAYLVTSTAVQSLYGRFSDIFGRKIALLTALGFFLLGSVLCSAAQSMTQLIVFRAIAGLGGGGIVTMVMVVVSDVVSLRERGKYQGILGAVVAIANSLGPLLGGALTASTSWRWCFIIAVPITLVAGLAVILLLPLKRVTGDTKSKLKKIDYLGASLVLAGTILVLLALNWGGNQYAWDSSQVLPTLIIGVATLVAFCLVEWKLVPLPIIPMRLFRNRTVSAVMVQTTCSGAIQYLLLYFVPQFSQVIKGYSGVKAGVTLIPLMALQAIMSTVAGIVVSKYGRYKMIILVGFAIYSIGVGLLVLLDQSSSIGEIIGFALLAGFGAGGTLQTTLVAAQNAVARLDMAVVTALRNFLRLFGGTISLAVSFAILNNTVKDAGGLDPETIKAVVRDPTKIRSLPGVDEQTRQLILQAYVKAFHNVFYFGLACILLAFVATLVGVKEYPLDRGDDRKLKDEGKQWMREREERKRGGHGNTQGQGASENSPTATARPSEDGRPDLGKHAAVGGMGIDEQSGGRLDGEDTKNTQGSRSASSTPGSEFERRLTETDIEKANS